MRAVALDVHRDFCEVPVVEEGALRSAGRVETKHETLELFAQSLGAHDYVALEAENLALRTPSGKDVSIGKTRRKEYGWG